MHFAPTIIGFPITQGVRPKLLTSIVLTWEAQEGTSTDFGRVQSQQLPCTSLAASASLLSSVTAFYELP